MDSDRPSPPSRSRHVARPFYLVAAMVLLGILGAYNLLVGASMAMVLREGALEDLDSVARSGAGADNVQDARLAVLMAARVARLAEIPHVSFPLSVGQALLAATLVLASTMVLAGRPSARSFALQAVGLNAVFALVQFVALRHLRGEWIDAGARAALVLPGSTIESTRAFGYWCWRAQLIFMELGIPLLSALALTRQRTKAYFAEAAAAAESAEEEP